MKRDLVYIYRFAIRYNSGVVQLGYLSEEEFSEITFQDIKNHIKNTVEIFAIHRIPVVTIDSESTPVVQVSSLAKYLEKQANVILHNVSMEDFKMFDREDQIYYYNRSEDIEDVGRIPPPEAK